ncbi:MAG: polymerase [Curvibacter sp. GWA2_64_110]|nr:MAG: polymerase [Curvibacter sp. GWA2_64_110]HCY16035.1 polymerase [Curvibacter sp.]
MPPGGGPTPSLMTWLFSVACTAMLLASVPAVELGTPRWRGVVAFAWLMAALISSLFGLVQYFDLEQSFHPWVSPSALGEAYANLRQRNQYATLMNIGLAALLWWTMSRNRRQGGSGLGVAGMLLFAAMLALGNATSSSRTGLLELILILSMALYWGAWRYGVARQVLIVAALTYGGAAIVLPSLAGLEFDSSGIFSRFSNTGADCTGRLTLWSNMLHLVGQRPWLGWGWGELDYAHFMAIYPGPRQCELLNNAHNLPLHLAVEWGLPVALWVCGAAAWLIWRAKPWRELDPARQMAWMVLAVILLHSMLEYPLWYGPFQMAFGLSLGLLWRPRQPPPPGVSATAALAKGRHMLAVALFGITAYAAWDYHRISQIYLPPEQRATAYRDHTLEKIRGSWLFHDQVYFAELTLTPLTRENAAQLNAMAHELLHFSPEAQVVEKLVESAVLLGRDDEARFFMARYRAAYPQAYDRWLGKGALTLK